MSKHHKLDEVAYQHIVKLCAQGNHWVDCNEFSRAIKSFANALEYIPAPYADWDAALWILISLGEAYFFNRDYEAAHDILTQAMHLPDAIGNPLLHLRLGQAQWERGEMKRALDELTRAYMAEGLDIFAEEDEKYIAFLHQNNVL